MPRKPATSAPVATAAAPFPIGFWNYSPIDQQRPEDIKDWADAGMTLTMGPNYGGSAAHLKKMRAILDAAHKKSIRIILCDERGYWPYLTQHGEEKFRCDFAQAVKDLGAHPAVVGFHVGDEPDAKQFPDACKALRLQREIAPQLQPFLNLLPMYQGIDSRIGCHSWDRYLDLYVEQATPPFLCYDCYAQMNPDAEGPGFWGWEMYFANLRTYWQAAMRQGMDYWTTLLSVGHFRYRCPNEDDIRWQVNTAAVHGCKGLLWFFFYMRYPHDNYRLSPIDEHGERTETFAWLSRVCRTFQMWHAPVLMKCKLTRSAHVGKSWGGWPGLEAQSAVASARSSTGTPLIVSEFRHESGADYVAVVNNSMKESTHAELIVRGRRPRLHRVGWHGEEVSLGDSVGQGAEHGEDYIKVSRWLAPGQLEMFRLEQAPGAAGA